MNTRIQFLTIFVAAALLQGCAVMGTLAKRPASLGPDNGTLIIVGGGGMPKVIFDRFFEAAGACVVLRTSGLKLSSVLHVAARLRDSDSASTQSRCLAA